MDNWKRECVSKRGIRQRTRSLFVWLLSKNGKYVLLEKFINNSSIFCIDWTYTILREKKKLTKEIKQIYYWQLIFNYLWTFIFFVFRFRLFSVLWIIILDMLVIYMAYQFYKNNKLTGYLQIPYIIWLIFATYLNITIYFLNRGI